MADTRLQHVDIQKAVCGGTLVSILPFPLPHNDGHQTFARH